MHRDFVVKKFSKNSESFVAMQRSLQRDFLPSHHNLEQIEVRGRVSDFRQISPPLNRISSGHPKISRGLQNVAAEVASVVQFSIRSLQKYASPLHMSSQVSAQSYTNLSLPTPAR